MGSVGTRSWLTLLVGRDNDDPLFLQVKEAEASVLEPFLTKSSFANHGQRVVEGQRLMQAASDIFLGWQRVDGVDGRTHDYYMRQLWDWKASADVDAMDPQVLGVYGQICAWALARAHARSGDRIAIAAYLGSGATFDRAIAEYARHLRRAERPRPCRPGGRHRRRAGRGPVRHLTRRTTEPANRAEPASIMAVPAMLSDAGSRGEPQRRRFEGCASARSGP